MICESCGIEAPTKYVELYQNIGLVILNIHESIKGNFCRTCIMVFCRKYTLVTVTAGWWGIFGIVLTPMFLLNNTVRYLISRRLPPVPFNEVPPKLTDDVINKLNLRSEEIIARLNSRGKLQDVAQDIAIESGVTPGQVVLYITTVSRSKEPTIQCWLP